MNTINSAIKELAEDSNEFAVCDHSSLSQSLEIKKNFIEDDGRHLSVDGVKMLASNMRKAIDNMLNIPYTPHRKPLNSNSNFKATMAMQKTQKRPLSTLYICSCNIDGVVTKDFNKHDDPTLINNIKYFDLIGLVGTHCIKSFRSPLPEYKIYHCHRVQNSKSRRHFGGIIYKCPSEKVNIR